MKLLIITQVIDTEHPILGFFHRWVEEFAKHCEKVHVICLQEGKHNLPDNVTVHSLGKEKGVGKLGYILRFYKLIWSLRNEYDNVFVHMNQIYVILGAAFWRLWGKKIGLWYAHGAVTSSLKLAEKLTHKIFTSTVEGMRIDSPKRIIVGQGIDLDLFKVSQKEKSNTLILVTVGRVSKSKNIDTLLKACSMLKSKNIDFKFKIIGPATIPSEVLYQEEMKLLTKELDIENEVDWLGPVTQSNLPVYLQKSDVFIHDGSTNSLDKALIEASLCGCVVVSSNPSYRSITSSIAPELLFSPKNEDELYLIIKDIKVISTIRTIVKVQKIRENFVKMYSISRLIHDIITKY